MLAGVGTSSRGVGHGGSCSAEDRLLPAPGLSEKRQRDAVPGLELFCHPL